MIFDHSGGKCVHQIDISVRCIVWMQKVSSLQIQFYCPPPGGGACASLLLERRCRINGLPDLVYYWASLKGGKKRAPDFDWWVSLSSQITAHTSPFSQVLCSGSYSHELGILICPDSHTTWPISQLHVLFGKFSTLVGIVILVCVSLCWFAFGLNCSSRHTWREKKESKR